MHIPRKRFGQHFLQDKLIIERIIHAIHPKSNEHLIEIGPGQGALTIPMLSEVKQLEAIELDRDLIPILKERAKQLGELNIHSADALTFDFKQLRQDERLLRIFGNLPYNISTPLIFHLLTYTSDIKDMVFMLQKEVASRMAALENTEDYGRLSVMVQYHTRVEILFDVPPHAFFPPPKVQSSIIRLTPHAALPHQANNYQLFEEVVKHAFQKRRKTLRNSLKEIIDQDEKWEHIPIRSDLRPENLSVKEFVEISNAIAD